jgi:hypothetical protein
VDRPRDASRPWFNPNTRSVPLEKLRIQQLAEKEGARLDYLTSTLGRTVVSNKDRSIRRTFW